MESQDEIIKRVEEILAASPEEGAEKMVEIHVEVNDLKASFYSMNHQMFLEQREKFVKDGGEEEEFEPATNPLESKFKELLNVYRDRRSRWVKAKEDARKAALEKKREVIKELEGLIENEENIGKAFDRFKDLQETWNKAGEIDPKHLSKIRNDYKALVDKFYYNININKELKEYDLSKNLELRETIIKKLEELKDEERIKDIEFILSASREQWEECGPVKHELYGDLRERYYNASRTLNKKIQDFYQARKAEMAENLAKKQAFIEEVQELLTKDLSKSKDWKAATDRIEKIREEWNKVGMVDRAANKQAWKDLKSSLDEFFSGKREFHAAKIETFNKAKELKEKLVEKAAEYAESDQWKDGAEALKKLQAEWKNVGSAGPRFENKLWEKFRGHADKFFNSRKEFYDTKDDREAANQKAKEELLKKMSKTELKGSKDENLATIRGLMDEWSAIGFVPKKAIDKLSKDYKKQLDRLYGALDMAKAEVEAARFKNRLEGMSGDKNSADQIDRERRGIRRKIQELESEKMTYENNMSFFKHAKDDNPLLIEAKKKIQKIADQIDSLKAKLKLLKQYE